MADEGPARDPLQIELVIFDCDGVLVDSEPIVNGVFREMLAELGLRFTQEQMYARFMGRSMQTCMSMVSKHLGHPPPTDFVPRFNQRCADALKVGLRPVAGVVRILDRLPVPVCVASSGEHAKLRLTLGVTGLLERFDGRIFSVTEVARGKPHPDVFLHAATTLGADPSRTAVVEDSVVGVSAAAAAGMTVLGYAAISSPAALAAAGARVFTRMSELPGLLGFEA